MGQFHHEDPLHLRTNIITRYKPTNPVNFYVGDIVEVQVVFVAFPVTAGKVKVMLGLRGITLIEKGHRTVRRLCFVNVTSLLTAAGGDNGQNGSANRDGSGEREEEEVNVR